MRIRKDTRDNDNIQREFKVTRFLWDFARKWHTSNKANKLDAFWAEVRTTLNDFDDKNPGAQRLDNQDNNVQMIRPGVRTPSAGLTRQEDRMTPPAEEPRQQTLSPVGRTRQEVRITPPAEDPLRQGPTTPPPVPEHSRPRAQTSPPVAGPSQPRIIPADTQNYPAALSTSSTISYISHRIPGLPKLTRLTRPDENEESDASEYLPKIKVKHEKSTNEPKRRRTPQPTGEVRPTTCNRCAARKIICYAQSGGLACVSCAKMKLKCDDTKEKAVKKEKEKAKTAEAKRARMKTRPKSTSGAAAPKARSKALSKVTPAAEEPSSDENSVVPSAPGAQGRTRSAKADGKRAEREKPGFHEMEMSRCK